MSDQVALEGIEADEQVQSTSHAVLGPNTCPDTDIFITNARPTRIDVKKVSYFSASSGKWNTEDLSDSPLDPGSEGIWWDEDLGAAQNDLLTHWRVYFRYQIQGQWTSVVFQEIDTVDEVCLSNANFEMTVR